MASLSVPPSRDIARALLIKAAKTRLEASPSAAAKGATNAILRPQIRSPLLALGAAVAAAGALYIVYDQLRATPKAVIGVALHGRAMSGTLTQVDVARAIAALQAKEAACNDPSERDVTVALEVLVDGKPTHLIESLSVCTCFRAFMSYNGFYAAFAQNPPWNEEAGKAPTESLATLPRSATETSTRVVVAATTASGIRHLVRNHQPVSIRRISGCDLVESFSKLAAGARSSGRCTVDGISVDAVSLSKPVTLNDSLQDLALLRFWSTRVRLEMALESWTNKLRQHLAQAARARKPESAAWVAAWLASPDAIQLLLAQSNLWVLHRSDGGFITTADGYGLVFTAPDLAARHILDAEHAHPGVARAVCARIDTSSLLNKLGPVGAPSARGWFGVCWNAALDAQGNATCGRIVQFPSARLREFIQLVPGRPDPDANGRESDGILI
jgi:hypothetical protein